MMILVCGLSKCGKTSLIQAAKSEGLSLPSVKASELLRSSGRPITALTASQALENQPELGNLLKAFIKDGAAFILDGHLLIGTVDGPRRSYVCFREASKCRGVTKMGAHPPLACFN